MIYLCVTGGQSGADLAGWRSAKACGIRTDGFMPKHFLTEDGPRPQYREAYNAREHPAPDYPSRRRANLDLTAMHGGPEHGLAIVFDATPSNNGMSPGTKGLFNDWEDLMRRGERCPKVQLVRLVKTTGGFRIDKMSPDDEGIAGLIVSCHARAIMIAGNRESKAPGIGAWVEDFMTVVFGMLKREGETP